MSDETYDRPNRATGPREVWERESDGECFVAHPECCDGIELVYRHLQSKSLGYWGYLESLPPDRYRIRTIPDSPWPPKVRIEKRWYNIYPAGLYESKQQADSVAAFGRSACIPLEVTCGEHGNVLRVIPVKEGE